MPSGGRGRARLTHPGLRTHRRRGTLPHPLVDPSYVSPVFARVDGFPPTLLVTGTRDLFLSSAVRLHRALRDAGVYAELHVMEAIPHGGYSPGTPEDQAQMRDVLRFVRAALTARAQRGRALEL